jgi:hypothetical protein
MTRLEAEFERCWQWLEAALKRGGPTHEKHHVRDLILSGGVQLWPLPNAALATEITVYPTGFKELRCWLAGGDKDEIIAATPAIEAWGKAKGCSRAIIQGRSGWKRVLRDYQAGAVILTKDI